MLDEADAGQAFCLVQTTVVYTTELSVPRQNFLMFILLFWHCRPMYRYSFFGAGGGAVKY